MKRNGNLGQVGDTIAVAWEDRTISGTIVRLPPTDAQLADPDDYSHDVYHVNTDEFGMIWVNANGIAV